MYTRNTTHYSSDLISQLESEIEVNCKQLSDEVAVSWVIDSTRDEIVIQICACVLVS